MTTLYDDYETIFVDFPEMFCLKMCKYLKKY